MTEQPNFTHKGWMLFCPIKLSMPYSESPVVAARWRWCEYLFDAAELVQGLVILLCSVFIKDYEPMFSFKVTGKL